LLKTQPAYDCNNRVTCGGMRLFHWHAGRGRTDNQFVSNGSYTAFTCRSTSPPEFDRRLSGERNTIVATAPSQTPISAASGCGTGLA
jgi:hypothetical protein